MSRYGEVALGVESALPARFELWRRRRRLRVWLLSGALVLLVLAGLSFLVYTNHGGGREEQAGSVLPASARSPALAASRAASPAAKGPAAQTRAPR
jgi:hypothetical protein